MIRRIPWRDLRDRLDADWRDGEHCSIIAPTGEGKTYLLTRGLLPLWRGTRTLIVDVKGDDPELTRGLRCHRLPGTLRRRWEDRQVPACYRLIPATIDENGRDAIRAGIRHAYSEGQWVIVLDETRAITDGKKPSFGLAGEVEQVWLRGRSRKVTLIAMTQAPRWVPSSFYDQPRHLFLFANDDARALRRLEEIGTNTAELVAAIRTLREHEFVYINRRRFTCISKVRARAQAPQAGRAA